MTMPCPANPPPPAGTTLWPAKRPVSQAILQWSRSNLKYPKGTLVTANVDGEDIVARLETHYHPPDGPIKPWGCHRGNTIYQPTSPLSPSQYGVQLPVTTAEVEAVDTTVDPWVQAGSEYYGERSTDWSLVAVSGGVIGLLVGMFLLALHGARNKR